MRLTLAALLLALPLARTGFAADEKEAMPEMTTYYFGMLLKGPKWSPEATPEREELQKQHVAHLTRMHREGHLVIAGPLLDEGAIRGLLVYKAASIEEARTWAEADPAVQAGRLKVEMHPWMVRKGILP
jgi:uncharacterized protein YciI